MYTSSSIVYSITGYTDCEINANCIHMTHGMRQRNMRKIFIKFPHEGKLN